MSCPDGRNLLSPDSDPAAVALELMQALDLGGFARLASMHIGRHELSSELLLVGAPLQGSLQERCSAIWLAPGEVVRGQPL